MKVLFVHNFYGTAAPSGENIAYQNDVAAVRATGCLVSEFTTHSDDLRAKPLLGPVVGAMSCVWNPFALNAIRRRVLAERPDVMHVHNVFPRLSPFVLGATAGTRTAVVMTLHNYRVFCAAGVATRDGEPCFQCAAQHSVQSAIRHRCYRGSFPATLPVATTISLHRRLRTYANRVDAFIALTDFQRDLFDSYGVLPRDKLHVRCNYMPGNPQVVPWGERDVPVVFAGRLDRHKGVHLLSPAWKAWGNAAPGLVILGDGPSRAELERATANEIAAGKIRLLGRLSPAEATSVIRRARLLVFPSIGLEGFPMVMQEAFAYGVPVVASDSGPLRQLVTSNGCGVVFPSGDPNALARVLRDLWDDEPRMRRLSMAARVAYESRYSETSATKRLLEVYNTAVAHRLRELAGVR